MVFFKNPPDRAVAGTIHNVEFHDLVLQQPQGPTRASLRGFGARQCDQSSFLLTVKNSRHRRPRPLLAAQNGLKALLNQLLACPIHRCSAGLQRLDDPAVAPSFASIRNVGLQQYPRLHQPLCRAFAFADHLVELLALVLAQPHHILLYRNRLASHDRPPSRLIATKGNQTFLSNSLKPTTSDIAARLMGQWLSERLPPPFLLEHRARAPR